MVNILEAKEFRILINSKSSGCLLYALIKPEIYDTSKPILDDSDILKIRNILDPERNKIEQ
jgi:hypothetical protein